MTRSSMAPTGARASTRSAPPGASAPPSGCGSRGPPPRLEADPEFRFRSGRPTVPALYLVVVSALVAIIAYRTYGAVLAAQVATLDDLRRTPAHTRPDR